VFLGNPDHRLKMQSKVEIHISSYSKSYLLLQYGTKVANNKKFAKY
jgi:hypothetical protein